MLYTEKSKRIRLVSSNFVRPYYAWLYRNRRLFIIEYVLRSIKAHPYFPIRNKQKWLAKGIVYYKRY